MSIANSWNFIRTLFDWDKFAKVTHNQYRVVSSRPYKDWIALAVISCGVLTGACVAVRKRK